MVLAIIQGFSVAAKTQKAKKSFGPFASFEMKLLFSGQNEQAYDVGCCLWPLSEMSNLCHIQNSHGAHIA